MWWKYWPLFGHFASLCIFHLIFLQILCLDHKLTEELFLVDNKQYSTDSITDYTKLEQLGLGEHDLETLGSSSESNQILDRKSQEDRQSYWLAQGFKRMFGLDPAKQLADNITKIGAHRSIASILQTKVLYCRIFWIRWNLGNFYLLFFFIKIVCFESA